MTHCMRLFIVAAVFAGMLGGVPVRAAQEARPGIEVAFSPGNAQALVVQAITSARRSIDVAAYSFTSRPIASALLAAGARGVGVRIVADRSQRSTRYTSVRYLAGQGIPVRIDDRYAIMHNKFMVIDGSTVQTGSFNYTRSAQLRNAENALVITGDRAVAVRYGAEWQRLWDESAPLNNQP
ncbi:MAG: phospholipase D family protein [Rhodanobacter sp.]